ncbi:MAG: exodeoxyribonuclease V subunit alpha [Desulfobacteraceae bacterium 4572_130]|nr:MAG: exodeoxyribonuclease V subunit alpha [Desulfobacteraceae bacterium 4572_130]
MVFDILFKSGFFSNLDFYFAKTISKIAKENNPIIFLSLALTSRAVSKGHVCFDIKEYAGKSINETGLEQDIILPQFHDWIKALKKSKIAGNRCDFPLVYDLKSRLYLAKYYDFQQRLIKNIIKRINLNTDNMFKNKEIFKNHDLFFNEKNKNNEISKGIINQNNAIKNAILKKISIISGGPGTGKTFITKKIIKLLNKQADFLSVPNPVIISMAPTGKAASKLENGFTIHRALGALKNTTGFKYNLSNQLVCDVVIVDEASMIDIALMTRLLEAVPLNAKLIMLGDKNQLASVETGAVFGDICRADKISDIITNLNYNFRSKGKTGIDKLAQSINNGDFQTLEKLLTKKTQPIQKDYNDISFIEIKDKSNFSEKIKHQIISGYLPFLKEIEPKKVLKSFNDFKILCAHKKGVFGVEHFNLIAEKVLSQHLQKLNIKNKFFKIPVMIKTNDYNKGLFNGDIGVCLKLKNNKIRVVFNDENNNNNMENLKYFKFSQLPDFDNAFAITVHKSQGSEFDNVLVVIPDKLSPVLTRELLYTSVTRAKKSVTILGKIDVIKKAVLIPVKRSSGITDFLNDEL